MKNALATLVIVTSTFFIGYVLSLGVSSIYLSARQRADERAAAAVGAKWLAERGKVGLDILTSTANTIAPIWQDTDVNQTQKPCLPGRICDAFTGEVIGVASTKSAPETAGYYWLDIEHHSSILFDCGTGKKFAMVASWEWGGADIWAAVEGNNHFLAFFDSREHAKAAVESTLNDISSKATAKCQ